VASASNAWALGWSSKDIRASPQLVFRTSFG